MRLAACALLAAAAVATPGAAEKFDWDALGAEFCARTTSGDLAGLRPLLTPELIEDIEFAYGIAQTPVPVTVFQSYTNRVANCEASTRNSALIEIRRSGPAGAALAWTEYVVVVPQADGTTRIDDVLFATRRSDTLRARLREIAN